MTEEQEKLYAILGDVNPEYALKYMTSFLLKFLKKEVVQQKRKDIFVDSLEVLGYIQKNNEITIPVIGKAEAFADPNAGNKVSKNNTVSFKGTQKTILTKYGQLFKIKEYKPGMFRMDPINEADLIPADLSLITENNELTLI